MFFKLILEKKWGKVCGECVGESMRERLLLVLFLLNSFLFLFSDFGSFYFLKTFFFQIGLENQLEQK